MSKRKLMDKTQARERRNDLLKNAAAADLPLTEGVREMRAIAGMTQEEFAQHRGVSARVIKAIERGQGNPTVATLNRIGEFFGLEVAFVPIRRRIPASSEPQPSGVAAESSAPVFRSDSSTQHTSGWHRQANQKLLELFTEGFRETLEREVYKALSAPDIQLKLLEELQSALSAADKPVDEPARKQVPATSDVPVRKKKKSGPP